MATKFFLLDAYGLIYRAYYALLRSPRITSYGLNTSAIFGFCNALDDILRKEAPDYIGVAFDPVGGATFRHEMYPDYKAGRDKQPEDITLAIPYIKRVLEAYRIPVIEVPGYEADDVVGTLARVAEEKTDWTTYMVTLDKDYGQLVRDRTFMYRPALRGQGFEIRTPREICQHYGVARPEQIIDLLALEGDSSDNVPGCPGVGEKTAVKLIQEFGSVDNMLEHADEIKGALGKKIKENSALIEMSRRLVTIDRHVPLPQEITLESFVREEPDRSALARIFNELEFRTMAARLGVRPDSAAPQEKPAEKTPAPDEGLGGLFDIVDEEPVSAFSAGDVRVLESSADVTTFVDKFLAGPVLELALVTDAPGEDAMTDALRGLALSRLTQDVDTDGAPVYESVYIPLRNTAAELLEPLRRLMDDARVTLVSPDVKRDMILLRARGLEWRAAAYFDTSVAHYLLSPESKHDLPTLAMTILGYATADYELVVTARKRFQMELTATGEAAAFYGTAAQLCLRLMAPLRSRISEAGQSTLLVDVELPMVRVLAEMEWTGVRIDSRELDAMSAGLISRIAAMEEEAFRLAGRSFNVGSPAQVGQVLFGDMAIDPKAKKTKGGAWSTTEEVLEKYRASHPIVQLILDIRGLRKLLSTYVESLPRMVNPATGKIHTTFNQTVTATGRLSSTNPNLQNIPIRTEEGREIRRAFIPDPGCLMLSADYSQIELRLMAHFSRDPEMLQAFLGKQDIHRATAAKIYHLDPAEVTDDQRRAAKTANFGIIYGISAFGLSERLGIPRAEAKALIEGYLRTYPQVQQYISDAIEGARRDGFVTTVMGRRRFLPDINSRNSVVRSYAERNAVNAPLQGSAADIIKVAMIRIYRRIGELGLRSRMILQVHDELIFNVIPAELATLQEMVVREMENAFSALVPLEVSAGVGANWLEAH